MTPPAAPLFDRSVLRARPQLSGADFLYVEAARELCERVMLTTRAFERALIVAPMTPGLDAVWRSLDAAPTFAAPFTSGGLRPDVAADTAQPFRRAFDLALSVNDLALANDPVSLLGEIRGTLRPDGLFLGATLVSGTLGELTDALLAAEAELSGGARMRVAPFADVRRWGDALTKAGFALPVADEVRLTVRYAHLGGLFDDLREMGLRAVLAQRAPAPKRLFRRAEAIYRERYASGDGRLPVTFAMGYLSGWAPDPSQRRAAKPGSANARLEDALRTFEPARPPPEDD